MPCRACIIVIASGVIALARKNKIVIKLPSCRFATLVIVSGRVSGLVGQVNARKATVGAHRR